LHVSAYRIKKQTALKYDNSVNIINKSKTIGRHTNQNYLEKASKEAIDVKLNLLNEYEKWLSNSNFTSDEIVTGLPKVEKKEREQEKENFVNTFDYSNIENYFFSDKIKIENLKLIELQMIEKKYFTLTGEWNIEKNKLVALIHILKQLNYLRPKIQGKGTKASLLAYRRFFEARYKTNVTEQMKPSKFNIGKLISYKPDFLFIPEIEKL